MWESAVLSLETRAAVVLGSVSSWDSLTAAALRFPHKYVLNSGGGWSVLRGNLLPGVGPIHLRGIGRETTTAS